MIDKVCIIEECVVEARFHIFIVIPIIYDRVEGAHEAKRSTYLVRKRLHCLLSRVVPVGVSALSKLFLFRRPRSREYLAR